LCSTTATPAARALGDFLRAAEGVGKLVFDVAEAGFCGGGEALAKRQMRKQQREVGSEFGHMPHVS
jgi:hypothetical protein